MLKRMEIPVTVYHLLQSVDKYGQPRLEWDNKIDTKAIYYITNKTTVSNPDYEDIDAIALMREKNFDSEYLISINGKNYRIQYSYPKAFGHRYTQYFLRDTNEEPSEHIEYGVYWKITEDTENNSVILNLRKDPTEGYELAVFPTEETYAPWNSYLPSLSEVIIENEIQPTTCYRWFNEARLMTTVTGLEKVDLTKCKSLYQMFRECNSLYMQEIKFGTTAPLNTSLQSFIKNCPMIYKVDVTGLCTSNCTSLNNTFTGCSALYKIKGLDTWDTTNVTEMNSLFSGLYNYTKIDPAVTNWNTAKVKTFNNLFQNSIVGCIDISGWDFSSATAVNAMFRYCTMLKSVDIKKFTPPATLTTMANMFGGCTELWAINCDDTTCSYPVGCSVSGVFTNCTSFTNWGAGTSADAWGSYVTANTPKCPAITFDSMENGYIKFTYAEALEHPSYYRQLIMPQRTAIGGWQPANNRYNIAYMLDGWYTGVDAYQDPFVMTLARNGYLCTQCYYEYPIYGTVPAVQAGMTSDYTFRFNRNNPLQEGEWYTFTLYINDQSTTQYSSYYTQEEYQIDTTQSGTYRFYYQKYKYNYQPTSNVYYMEFTIE